MTYKEAGAIPLQTIIAPAVCQITTAIGNCHQPYTERELRFIQNQT